MSPASQCQVRNYFRKSHKALEMITGKAPWSGIDLKGLMPGKNNGQFPISFLPTISVQYISISVAVEWSGFDDLGPNWGKLWGH